jgi:hypothetical protein
MSCRIAAVALLLAACAAEDSVVELGVIEYHAEPTLVEAPSNGIVGQPVTVRVVTYGGGCEALERTDVEVSRDGADVTPFVRRAIPGEHEACTDILLSFQHEASVVFDTTGTKTIRVHGRRVNQGADEEIEISRVVIVE